MATKTRREHPKPTFENPSRVVGQSSIVDVLGVVNRELDPLPEGWSGFNKTLFLSTLDLSEMRIKNSLGLRERHFVEEGQSPREWVGVHRRLVMELCQEAYKVGVELAPGKAAGAVVDFVVFPIFTDRMEKVCAEFNSLRTQVPWWQYVPCELEIATAIDELEEARWSIIEELRLAADVEDKKRESVAESHASEAQSETLTAGANGVASSIGAGRKIRQRRDPKPIPDYAAFAEARGSLSHAQAADQFGISPRQIQNYVKENSLRKTARGRILIDDKFISKHSALFNRATK